MDRLSNPPPVVKAPTRRAALRVLGSVPLVGALMRPAPAAPQPPEPPRDVIAIQPSPLQALVSRMPMPGGVVTAIARAWRPGDVRPCRLCPRCRADHEHAYCLVMVARDVPGEAAPLFSLHGLELVRQDPGPALSSL